MDEFGDCFYNKSKELLRRDLQKYLMPIKNIK